MGSNQEKGTQTYIAGHNIAEADQTSSYTSEYSTDTDKVTLPKEREFHHVKTSTYWLPKDDDERMRLTGVRRQYQCSIILFLLNLNHSNILL